MTTTSITFDQAAIQVNLIGTDHKLIPSLLSALRQNKITLNTLPKKPVQIDLLSSEAYLYSEEGDKYRIPIF